MSLKNIGEIGQVLNLLKSGNTDTLKDVFNGLSKGSQESLLTKYLKDGQLTSLIDTLSLKKDKDGKMFTSKGLEIHTSVIDKVTQYKKKTDEATIAIDSLEKATYKMGADGTLIPVIGDVADGVGDVVEATEELGSSGAAGFSSLATGAKAFLATINPMVAIIAGAAAALLAFKIANDKFGFTYEASMKNLKSSLSDLSDGKSELETLESQGDNIRESLSDLAGKYEIKIDDKDSSNNIIQKLQQIKQEKMYLEDGITLDKLSSKNADNLREQQIKKNVVAAAQQKAAREAVKTYNKQVYRASESYIADPKYVTPTSYGEQQMTSEADAVRKDVDAIRKYNKLIDETKDKMKNMDAGSREFKNAQHQIDEYNESIEKLNTDMSDRQENLQTILSGITDENGQLLSNSYKQIYDDVIDAIEAGNRATLSDAEYAMSKLSSFFNGSLGRNKIKEDLIASMDGATNKADALENALASMGLTLDDIGVENISDLEAYLRDASSAAEETKAAINSVEGTVVSLTSALSSQNKGAGWSTVSGAIDTIKELHKAADYGTDEYKEFIQMMTRNKINADATEFDYEGYLANYDAAMKKAERYFGKDSRQSMINAFGDLKKVGLASEDGDKWRFTENFTSSAQAADAFGVSLAGAEAILEELQNKGFEFGDDFEWNGSNLENFKSSLEEIRSIYEQLDDSDPEKARLKMLLDGWDEVLPQYEEGIQQMNKDALIKIRTELDMSSLHQQLQTALDTAINTDKVDDWATAEGAAKATRTAWEKSDNNTWASDDKGYQSMISNYNGLSRQLTNKSLSEDARKELVQQKIALDELAASWNQFRSDGGDMDWSSWIKSDEANKALNDVITDTGLAKDKIAEALNMDEGELKFRVNLNSLEDQIKGIGGRWGSNIVMDISADTGQIEQQLAELQNGQILHFKADVTGTDGKTVTSMVNASNVDGKITYTANIGGVEQVLKQVQDADGTFHFEVVGDGEKTLEKVKSDTESLDGSEASVKLSANDEASPKISAVNSGLSGLHDKTVTIYGNTSPITAAIADAKQKLQALRSGAGTYGVSQLSGTAHLSGTAYASGILPGDVFLNDKYATKYDDVALTGEVGQELVATREGYWYTVGDHGAEFAHIPAGSIVFDALQTKQLLADGHINSRGAAYLSGTAYNTTGGGPNLKTSGTGKTSSKKKKKKNSSSKSSGKSSSKSKSSGSSGNSDSSKSEDDLFDYIEIYLSRMKDLTDEFKDAIEDAVGLSDKLQANQKTLSQLQAEITANQQGYDRYLQQANSVGLSEDYKAKVRSGAIDIEKITDENLKKNVEEYKKWYENAEKCRKSTIELRREEQKLAKERLDTIKDFYDLVTKVSKSVQEANDSWQEANDKMGFVAFSDAVKANISSSIEEAEKIHDLAEQRLAEYQKEFNNLVSQGYIKEGSDAWYEAKAEINDLTKSVHEAVSSLVDYKDKLDDVEFTRIEFLINTFERAVEKIKAWSDLQESRDITVQEPTYLEQLENNNSKIEALYEKRSLSLRKQNLEEVGSKRYDEFAKDINDADKEILQLQKDNEELKNSIFTMRFKPLDDMLDKYDKLSDEVSTFRELINEDAYLDKSGALTADGVANLALLSQQMEIGKQKVSDLREGLEKLQESFDNGVISEVEFNEKSEEYRKTLQGEVVDIKKLSDTMTNLYLEQMKKENDALKKLIDQRKKALQARQEYEDYSKKVGKESKDVDMLNAQIQALEGVNNAASRAELKKLQQQMKDAQDTLDDTKRQHSYDMQNKGYDAMSESLDKTIEDLTYNIAHSAEEQERVITSMLSRVVGNYQSAFSQINSIITNTGWVGSNGFNQEQSQISTQSGAQSQISTATTSQQNFSSSSTAKATVTSPINDNAARNAQITEDIMQKPNTDNRLVAELTIKVKSVTLEEGKSTSVTATVRPGDAKNKTLSWTSSNTAIARVSNGSIYAVKPGSATIIVSTTDGSGLTQSIGVTVTKKPEPPKPQPAATNQGNTSGGDGVPRVGDVVTFTGKYYYDSWGKRPTGSKYSGVPNAVVINGYSSSAYGGRAKKTGDYAVNISDASGVYGNLGWVKLSQLSGYAKGTAHVPYDQLAEIDEQGRGTEAIIAPDGRILKPLAKGSAVLNKEITQNIMDWGKINPAEVLTDSLKVNMMNNVGGKSSGDTYEIHFDSLMTVNGDIDKEVFPGVKKMCEESYQYWDKRFAKELKKR